MALINRPSLLIADEPTTGLDVTVQSQVLELLRQFSQSGGMSTLIITHDLGIIAHFCDRMAVMFAGRIVEIGPVKDVFEQPRHPYTQSLINSTPSRQVKVGFRTELGEPPNLYALGAGCSYAYRCRHAAPRCEAPVFEQAVGPGHMAACHRLDEIGQGVALERT
jgi:peptide/nickel transport system ATP-binding protein/oligopeptide transport system ATP-binding protein